MNTDPTTRGNGCRIRPTRLHRRLPDESSIARWSDIRRDGHAARRLDRRLDANPYCDPGKAGMAFEEWIFCLQAWAAGWRDEDAQLTRDAGTCA